MLTQRLADQDPVERPDDDALHFLMNVKFSPVPCSCYERL